ncbi:MAG: methylated-DNA--[protein]-cysteine S-methyltransferase [Maricaulaceae bacterium]
MMTDAAHAPARPLDNQDALTEAARDYALVSQALSYLGEAWRDRPDLDAIAQRAGLSPAHFHRVFRRWTGTSPKRVVDALALHEARTALDAGASVLDASLEAGLSGPSRLHDLFIAEEATTPGAARRKGEGLSFTWGRAPTPFGLAVVLIAPRGLSGLAFAAEDDPDGAHAFADMRARYPGADYTRNDAEALGLAAQVFAGAGSRIPLALYGTPWQRQVWRALIRIPPGATTSYRAIAEEVCTAKASRAVGAAVGRNPISWLIPCHRVLARDDRLTGYHWGVDRKRAMLVYEAEQARAMDTRAAP